MGPYFITSDITAAIDKKTKCRNSSNKFRSSMSSGSEVPQIALRCLQRISQRVPITNAVIRDTSLAQALSEAGRDLVQLLVATKAAHGAAAAVELLPSGVCIQVFICDLSSFRQTVMAVDRCICNILLCSLESTGRWRW
jgi:hypothetical protein